MSERIPRHIVLFPDGNRRWAQKQGLTSFDGHMAGEKKFADFLAWCRDAGVEVVTVFGFSSENWSRSKEEVKYLMELFEKYLGEGIDEFNKESIRIRIIGQREKLPPSLQKVISRVEHVTQGNKKMHLNLAVSYGGKWDIVQAVKKIVTQRIPAEAISEELIHANLSTADLPDPDLVIRAGGEMRLSNFVLWQSSYAELYFSSKLWPDFSKEDFAAALDEFDRRQRRFGK